MSKFTEATVGELSNYTEVRRIQSGHTRGLTIAEALVGMVVLALLLTAVLGTLIQASYLERTDEEQTEVLAVVQGLIESRIDEARTPTGFQNLQSHALAPTPDPGYLWEEELTELDLGLKKLTVSLYHADPNNPAVVDASRIRGGHAITLSVTLVEPTP